MPSQADYTHSEASLVPEGLRVYRHFTAMPVDDGYLLWAMAQSKTYHPQLRPYEAVCRKGPVFSGPVHPAPDPSCKCGFYASYDPAIDFYPDNVWGKNDTGDSGGAFIVRTVVEMSGRVVMGRKGVRAEKMKIVAVAVDWSKFIWYDGDDPFELTWEVVGDRLVSARYRRTPDPEELAEYEALASSLAFAYGAKYFPDADAMHDAFPAPDIEHLKPKPDPFVEGVPLGGYITQAQLYASMQAVSDAFTDMRKAIAKLADASLTISSDQVDSSVLKGETARERALRLKRDPKRKGPASGKGIDYRK